VAPDSGLIKLISWISNSLYIEMIFVDYKQNSRRKNNTISKIDL